MCQNCFNELRVAMTANNDQKNLDKLAVLEEASAFQEKTTGVGLEGVEIMLSLILPIELLKERLEEYKKEQVIRKQMQQN